MIEKLQFGRSEHMSTRVLFGGAALARVNQADADRTLEVLLEYGINHIDTAASYGDAELRIGPWMKEHRQNFFLATKTEERTYSGAWEELQRSLKRLRVDQVDLWQMHLLIDPQEWEIAMGDDGVLRAFIEAREKGLVRFLGVTGHGVTAARMHMKSLARFDFDSVLLPNNFFMMQDEGYARDYGELVAYCREKNVAVQTIKSLAARPWGGDDPERATWYRPFERQSDIDLAVSYVLSQPGIFLNSVGDIDLLPRVLDAAVRAGRAPRIEEMEALADRVGMATIF